MSTSKNIIEERGSDAHLSQLASVGQIAAGIAHEVRNPLTAVKGFLQLLQQEEKHTYIDIAQSELDHALSTLNNLLQVSKPDLEEEDFQMINMSVELEAILNLFQDKMYNIQFITDFQDANATIIGKKNQFKKAFFNLIKNAIESIDGKGSITITHKASESEVIVTIKDTGSGIPKEKLSLLGTPFFSTKAQGTGMGLTQVFTVIYQHGGKIIVNSEEQKGTTFMIHIPKQLQVNRSVVRKLNLTYSEGDTIKSFLLNNSEKFEEILLDEAINVKDKIAEIQSIGNINLLRNAHKLVQYVVEEREHELISFAKQEGIAWAKYSLTLPFKLEWVQAIRRTLWDFLYNFDLLNQTKFDQEAFYSLEKRINILIDQFFTYFFISYSNYKDNLLEDQRKLVENLSVPIIPINKKISILPLVGLIDNTRVRIIRIRVLEEIENKQIQTLIIDLSGIATMDLDAMKSFMTIFEGISLMGCKTVITGLRAEIVNSMMDSNINLLTEVEAKGTLQLALNDLLLNQEKY